MFLSLFATSNDSTTMATSGQMEGDQHEEERGLEQPKMLNSSFIASASSTFTSSTSSTTTMAIATIPPASEKEEEEQCPICLQSLSTHMSITLACEHTIHLECLRQQLMNARPNPSTSLSFIGLYCPYANCKQAINHPQLQKLVTPLQSLLDSVNLLLTQNEKYTDYIFYLCSICFNPFIGGMKTCAASINTDIKSEERVCSKCMNASSIIAAKCERQDVNEKKKKKKKRKDGTQIETVEGEGEEEKHDDNYVWKCRFCCKIATVVNYGSMHLCDACNNRDIGAKNGTTLRIPPVKCLGRDNCEIPFVSHSETYHKNGPSIECEQVLYCIKCTSMLCETDNNGNKQRKRKRSTNLIYNSNGVLGMNGWMSKTDFEMSVLLAKCKSEKVIKKTKVKIARRKSGPDVWITEKSNGHANFVASYEWACMAQCIDLNSVHGDRESVLGIEVDCLYGGRKECKAVFKVDVVVYDEVLNEVGRICGNELVTGVKQWDNWSCLLDDGDMVRKGRFVVVAVYGKDCKYWAGRFGAKVRDVSVRLVYDQFDDEDDEDDDDVEFGVDDDVVVVDGVSAGATMNDKCTEGGVGTSGMSGPIECLRQYFKIEECEDTKCEVEDKGKIEVKEDGSGKVDSEKEKEKESVKKRVKVKVKENKKGIVVQTSELTPEMIFGNGVLVVAGWDGAFGGRFSRQPRLVVPNRYRHYFL